jgi:glycosyltransferase involved in cell wall biosynthesis
MSDTVAILIPTFGRPQRAAELVEDIRVATTANYRIYFVVEKHDPETIAAVGRLDAEAIINPGEPTYASCINSAYAQTKEPYFFTGADDIHFHPGWLSEALKWMSDPKIGIVGTADPLHDSRDHSTHSLVRRKYIQQHSGCLDRPNTVLYPYWHGWTDHEFLGIAKSRGAYHYCKKSLVDHHHPGWDWFGRVDSGDEKFDATYAKGNRNHRQDTRKFLQRCRQWIDSLPDDSPSNTGLKKFVRRNSGLHGKIRYGLREIRAALRHEMAR